jgi:transposase
MPQRYPTDLTDMEWTILAPFIPAAKSGGRPRTTDMREVVNAILYSLRSGCQWRMLPADFPPHQTVYHYFRTCAVRVSGSGCTTRSVVTCERPRAARVRRVQGSSTARR